MSRFQASQPLGVFLTVSHRVGAACPFDQRQTIILFRKSRATTILTRGGSEEVRSSVLESVYKSSAYCAFVRKPPPRRFGICSVSVPLPHAARKIRYLSSAYDLGSALSELLIIGRSKAAVRRFGGRCRASPSGPTIFFIVHRVSYR